MNLTRTCQQGVTPNLNSTLRCSLDIYHVHVRHSSMQAAFHTTEGLNIGFSQLQGAQGPLDGLGQRRPIQCSMQAHGQFLGTLQEQLD